MKKILLFAIGLSFLSFSLTAQKVNTDSLKLIAKISDDELKLGKLENMVEQKTTNKKDAAVTAQNSANVNANAAENLTSDPTNKKLASEADNKAVDAKKDSRKSRKEASKLDDLNKNIVDLKAKIAKEQAKLSTYRQPMVAMTVETKVLPQPDTTLHQ
jgi:cell division protein FtsL